MANPRKATSGSWFTNFANVSAAAVGSPPAFIFALATVVAWLISGPFFHYSDAWQLVVNSWTNVMTFLVVFLIQNSQNRDSRAVNLKLDELIRSTERAHNEMIDIEKLSDQELESLAKRYERIRQEWDERRTGRGSKRP
ncbi:MAG TPA: low affinity iron permease family protein [Terriglobales bacterium]|jgi:low affinity Fe/Cu permease|nr:low affinity iron permease family protein [Terriglobales bacterium]